MEKLTITKIFTKQEKSKEGKPYTRLAIKTDKYNDRWLSGFGNKFNDNWKEGDVVEVEVTEATAKDKNGKPYLNFRSVSKLELLEKRVKYLEDRLNTPAGGTNGRLAEPEEINEADLPF